MLYTIASCCKLLTKSFIIAINYKSEYDAAFWGTGGPIHRRFCPERTIIQSCVTGPTKAMHSSALSLVAKAYFPCHVRSFFFLNK